MSYQQVIVVGNTGQQPELRYLPSGEAVATFSLASNEEWTDRKTNEKRSRTTWFRVSCWGNLGEVVNQYVHKGSLVMVIGTVEARAYTNHAGEAAASLELRARDVRFLGGGERESAATEPDTGNIPF